MRIRTVKPEFFNHESLFDLEYESSLPIRLAFIGLWCAADRDGRFKWEPRRLGVQILPFDGIDFSRVLDALMTRGFIHKYGDDIGVYGVIPSFGKHQVINNRERDSELPDPLNCNDFDARLTRDTRVTHASKEEGKGSEGRGTERNEREEDSLARFPVPRDLEGAPIRQSIIAELESHIQALKPAWRMPFTHQEMRGLLESSKALASLTAQDWQILKSYLSAKIPEGTPKYQPNSRLKFIEAAPDIWAYAFAWNEKNRSKPIKMPPIVKSEQTDEDKKALEEFIKATKKP